MGPPSVDEGGEDGAGEGAAAAPRSEAGGAAAGEAAAAEATTWPEIRARLRLTDGAAEEFIRLFERRYEIASPVEALVKTKHFLAEYLVQDFDYKAFCLSLGKVTVQISEDEERWNDHVSKNLSADLGSAAAVMLRLAATIARAFDLRPQDWKDINNACGSALRAVPACYRLQRALPGALNDARALRYLPVPTTDAGRDLNPWKSEEGRRLFEDAHSADWALIESLTAQDKKPSACFSGTFAVEEVTKMEGLTSVYMRALRLGEAPGGVPAKEVEAGDPMVWELDAGAGALLEPGLAIEGDWYELETEVCFMSALTSVTPLWALAVQAEADVADADEP